MESPVEERTLPTLHVPYGMYLYSEHGAETEDECSLLSAQCSVLSAQCSVLSAQCLLIGA